MISQMDGHFLNPPVFLAPMAGITDVPFRSVVLGCGAGFVVSEMVASAEMVHAKSSVRSRALPGAEVRRSAVQLAGREAGHMAEAARICEAGGAGIIDINFGCPAKKVTNGWSGAALMREPDHAMRLVDAVVAAVDVPVTLKMRLGWDENQLNAPEIAKRAENAGVRMITVHGRTRCQFYKGSADWAKIAPVVEAVNVPVIANGDIVDASTARQAMSNSGARSVMVGRGAQGQPWIINRLSDELNGRTPPEDPGLKERTEIILTHYDHILSFYGRDLGVRVARKHLGWYLERVDGATDLRARVLRMGDPNDVSTAIGAELPHCSTARMDIAS